MPTLESLPQLATNPGVHALIGIASGFIVAAVTHDVRMAAIRRDHGCTDTSGERHFGILEASHRMHTKTDPNYNTTQAIDIKCSVHHLTDHLENEGRNGLNRHQNAWAIRMIADRIGKLWMEAMGIK